MTITQSGRLASIWVVPQDIPVPLYFYTMGFFYFARLHTLNKFERILYSPVNLYKERFFMKWTGLNELREKFLEFFESKGCLRLPSFSLVPKDDNSLLLINSGMAPMKNILQVR